ncbi:MAG: vWA domain-containing protein, partial [Pseudomonadota bacterium]
MMRLLATALAAICLATAAAAQGAPGRVIVLDVSGSMTSQDFRGGTQSRWDQALDVLDELLAQLEASGDTTPTAFGQFGAEFRWADVAGQFGRNPDNVPPDHPLCRDVAFPTDFGQLGGAQSRDILRQATAGTPSGMTPIAEALEQALARLERFGAGEIVLISDMEDPNCLAPGQSLCDAISMALDAFRAPTGQMLVEFRVLAIPNATVAEALAECAPTTTFALSTVDPDP